MSNPSTSSERTACVLLAAGKGTRMKSALAKVLHPVLGKPMIGWLVDAALQAGCDRVIPVIGYQGEAVQAQLMARPDAARLTVAWQREQNGTGHAVQCAVAATEGCDDVLIAMGDTPALDAQTMGRIIAARRLADAPLVVATARMDDPTGYGRIIRDGGGEGDDDGGSGSGSGRVIQIIEHADATGAQRAIDEVNMGVYCVRRDALVSCLGRLGTDNAQGEFYLTDVVAMLHQDGDPGVAYILDDPGVAAGINHRGQLAAAEAQISARLNDAWMQSGVAIHDPSSVRVEAGVEIGRDSVIGQGVQLLGHTRVGKNCRVDAGCILTDCTLADGVHLKPYVVAEGSSLAAGAVAGPFTHLRPGTELGPKTKVGNFVETKKAILGEGSKASHLSYLGDCTIGRDVNIGAGTITCNYDGAYKHQTVLEDGVFIGSDTQLVAPVTVGKNATVGAGTTVTQDVPEGALVVSRAPQKHFADYYERRRKPREAARAAEKRAAKTAKV